MCGTRPPVFPAMNAQPLKIHHLGKTLAIATTESVNARQIRAQMEDEGSIFQTTTDSEVVLHLIAKAMKKGLERAMLETMSQVKGLTPW